MALTTLHRPVHTVGEGVPLRFQGLGTTALLTAGLPLVCVAGLGGVSPVGYGLLAGLAVCAAMMPRLGTPSVPLSALLGMVLDRQVGRIALAGTALGLTTIGDGFVYLLLLHRSGLDIGWLPLLAAGSVAAQALLTPVLAVVVERTGRTPVLPAGHLLLAAAYWLTGGPLEGPVLLLVVVLLLGARHAVVDHALVELAWPVLPEWLRPTGLAVVQVGQALGCLTSSVLFGLAWQHLGADTAADTAAVGAALAVAVAAVLLVRPDRRRGGRARTRGAVDRRV